MHLVVGADQFLGRGIVVALKADVPVIELNSDADEQTLREMGYLKVSSLGEGFRGWVDAGGDVEG